MKKVIGFLCMVILLAGFSVTAPAAVESAAKVDRHLTIQYVFEDGTPAAPSYEAVLQEGAGFGVASPSVDGYTAASAYVSGTMMQDEIFTVIYYPKSYELRVTAVFEDGNKPASGYEDYILVKQYQDEYQLAPYPPPDGYCLTSAVNEQGTMPPRDLKATFVYSPMTGKTVEKASYWVEYYVFQDGAYRLAGKSEEKKRPVGTALTLELVTEDLGEGWLKEMEPEGYARVRVEYGKADGGWGVKVFYRPEPDAAWYVRVNYLDRETGRALRDPWMDKLSEGTAYDLSDQLSLGEEGQYALEEVQGDTAGVMGRQDVEINAYYRLEEYPYEVAYFADGESVGSAEGIAPFGTVVDSGFLSRNMGSGWKDRFMPEGYSFDRAEYAAAGPEGAVVKVYYAQEDNVIPKTGEDFFSVWTYAGMAVICLGIINGILIKVKRAKNRRGGKHAMYK